MYSIILIFSIGIQIFINVYFVLQEENIDSQDDWIEMNIVNSLQI